MNNNQDIIDKLNNKTFRRQILDNPKKYLPMFGYDELPDDVQVAVKINTKNVIYMIVPDDLDDMDIDQLQKVAAGKAGTLGSAGTVSSAVTFSSATTCAATVSTVGSVASVGSVGDISPGKINI